MITTRGQSFIWQNWSIWWDRRVRNRWESCCPHFKLFHMEIVKLDAEGSTAALAGFAPAFCWFSIFARKTMPGLVAFLLKPERAGKVCYCLIISCPLFPALISLKAKMIYQPNSWLINFLCIIQIFMSAQINWISVNRKLLKNACNLILLLAAQKSCLLALIRMITFLYWLCEYM